MTDTLACLCRGGRAFDPWGWGSAVSSEVPGKDWALGGHKVEACLSPAVVADELRNHHLLLFARAKKAGIVSCSYID